MAEKTAAEMRSDLASAHQAYMAELREAGPVWEQKLATAGEGEDAWSARQVAEHIAGASLFFAGGIAEAIGVTAPARTRVQLATADEAVAATTDNHAALDSVVANVSDEQLAMDIDHPRLGKQTLGGIIGIVAYHYRDHANQLKTLRG